MKYTSRGLRRRRNTDQWECTLSHKDPLTGKIVRSFHTIEAKTQRQAEKARDALIVELELKGGAADSTVTIREFMESYLDIRETGSSARTIPLTSHLFSYLAAMKSDSDRIAREFGLAQSDPYILGTQEPMSRPYNPTQLGKDFAAFCKMNNFECRFHDLRHTFATMMIAGGTDVRTVASYLGHASVSMTLNIYANVDPDAKKAAVSKVEDSFDLDFYDISPEEAWSRFNKKQAPVIAFTEEQLLAMLEEVRKKKNAGGVVACV